MRLLAMSESPVRAVACCRRFEPTVSACRRPYGDHRHARVGWLKTRRSDRVLHTDAWDMSAWAAIGTMNFTVDAFEVCA
jgi:hypothetical protein